MAKKLNYEQVKSFVESNNGCKLLSEKSQYYNSHTELKIMCHCGESFYTTFRLFKNNNKRQCDACGIKIKKYKMTLPYQSVIEQINKTGCKVITSQEEYENAKFTKLKIQCSCGNIFQTTYSVFVRSKNPKNKCDDCTKKAIEQRSKNKYFLYKEYIENEGHQVLTSFVEFKNATTKLKIKCPLGHIYYKTWVKFLSGQRCTICSGKKKYTFQEVKEIIESESGYKLLSNDYKNCKTKLKIQCNKGHIYEVTFDSFVNNKTRCPYCDGNARKNIEEIKSEFFKFGYVLKSTEYLNAQAPLVVICPTGHEYIVNWNHFQIGNRCPHCNASKGERTIRNYLESSNIVFQPQWSFNDLLSDKGNVLKFDFAIFDKSNMLQFLIEFDGIFHYEKQYEGDGSELVQHHDQLKNTYCQENNIPLLRIPYWEFDNIEKILTEKLKQFNLINN